MWFNNLFRDIEQLGFVRRDSGGKLVIPDDQLSRILNFNETCLSVDGSQGQHGGRPAVSFWDPCLPQIDKATRKSALISMMSTGSTVASKAIPPHSQFQTKAKTNDGQRFCMDMFKYMHTVVGKFGCSKIRQWSVTIGLNRRPVKVSYTRPSYFKRFVLVP